MPDAFKLLVRPIVGFLQMGMLEYGVIFNLVILHQLGDLLLSTIDPNYNFRMPSSTFSLCVGETGSAP